MYSKALTILFCLLSTLPMQAANQRPVSLIEIEAERQADLNIPRAGHQVFYVGGELTVAGGHTDGFVPTPTAEFFKDGEWHTMDMTYAHDFGISVVLRSGKVLLAGGCEQPTGIGQTFSAEMYDPQTHSFRGFGNMSLKRVWASALELDSGQVVIAGNWYHTDGIEVFCEGLSSHGDYLGKQSFTYVKDVAAARCMPYIFRLADDDALILGSITNRGDTVHNAFADRLRGDTVHIPLFETWHPLLVGTHHDEASMIDDKAKNGFTYLLAVQDSTGQVAIAQVCGTNVTLLPTASAIPMESNGERIEYSSNIIADRVAGRAYLVGISSNYHAAPEKARLYVLGIDYAHVSDGGAPLTLYYTGPLDVVPDCVPLLTPEGNLLIAGGLTDCSNFTPSASVWLLRLGRESEMSAGGMGWWIWALPAAFALAAVIVSVLLLRNRRKRAAASGSPDQDPAGPSTNAELMDRISRLMEERQLYLNPDLKMADISSELGLNRSYVSDCINSQTGGSFSQYVNGYRIRHAKTLLRSHPDMKMTSLYMLVGFSSEQTFYRTFKAVIGMTPKEWVANGKD